jgi:hypothetical protein
MPEVLVPAHCPLARQQSRFETINEGDTQMTKPTWTLDAKNRLGYYGDDVTVEFQRVDGAWIGTAKGNDGEEPMFKEALETEALGLWEEQIEVALGYLRFIGTTIYGENWIVPLASDTKMNPSKIKAWLTQDEPLAMNDAHWILMLTAMEIRKDKIYAATLKIRTAYFEGRRKVGDPYERRVKPGLSWSEMQQLKPGDMLFS